MDRKRILGSLIPLLVLAACGGGGLDLGAPTTTNSESDAVAPSTVGTTTTVEPQVCSDEALSGDIGIPMVLVSECADGWAMAAETEYLESCQECESALLVHRLQGTWSVAFNCYGYLPLSPDICSTPATTSFPSGSIDTGARLPALKTACAIWPMNTYSEFLVSAGCFGDAENLRYSEIPDCPKPYLDVTMAPIHICSKGTVVRDVQTALADAGYRVTPDGFFGVSTLRAFINWQKANGLLVTGVVEEADLCRLGVPQC